MELQLIHYEELELNEVENVKNKNKKNIANTKSCSIFVKY